MKYTKEEVTEMLKNSLVLKENNELMNFWLNKLNEMTEDELLRLADILKLEREAKNKSHESVKAREIEINKKYLYDLKVFKGKTLPSMLKNMEGSIRKNENPDQILNDLNNA